MLEAFFQFFFPNRDKSNKDKVEEIEVVEAKLTCPIIPKDHPFYEGSSDYENNGC